MPDNQTRPDADEAPIRNATEAPSTEAAKALEEHRHFEAAHVRTVEPPPEGEKIDHMAEREAKAEDRQEALVDEALEETFPGSDPISPKHIT